MVTSIVRRLAVHSADCIASHARSNIGADLLPIFAACLAVLSELPAPRHKHNQVLRRFQAALLITILVLFSVYCCSCQAYIVQHST